MAPVRRPTEMTADTHPLLAREGWLHVSITAAAALLVALVWGWWWSVPAWFVVAFVVQFFRDPGRNIANMTDAVVCPADGKIVYTGTAEDPYLKRPSVKISVFMNVFSVHSNRVPVTGVVQEIWYTTGKFFNAELDKSSSQNERNAVWIRTAEGEDVVCVQVAGLIARRILCYLQIGDKVRHGQRYGFIRFGSRVDVYLPPSFRSSVGLGDWVYAGRDSLGRFTAAPHGDG